MVIKCKECGVALSNDLTRTQDEAHLSEDDTSDFIPIGYYTISDGEYFTNSDGNIIINKNDLINTQNHFDKSRLNGCCDMDGTDGINKLCKNRHEVATAKLDCWMPHCIIFDSSKITTQ